MKSRVVFLVLAWLLLLSQAVAGIRIKGKIIGADGRPPALAHVHVAEPGNLYRYALLSVAAEADGQFEVAIEKPGYYSVWITAVNHYATEVMVGSEKNGDVVELQITPKPYSYHDAFQEVKIMGDWNGFKFSAAEPMQRREDGTFVYSIQARADTLAYQLLRLEKEGHSINGTMQDYFVYDGGGDYRSVLKTKPGQQVRIVFDPRKLMRTKAGAFPKLSFDSKHQWLMQAQKFIQQAEKMQKAFIKEMQAYRKDHDNMDDFQFDASAYLNYFKQQAESASHPFLRSLAHVFRYRISYMADSRFDASEYKRILTVVPPESPAWGYGINFLSTFMGWLGPDKGRAYLQAMLDKNPLSTVRAHVLATFAMEAKTKGDKETWKKLYAQLEQYDNIPMMAFYKKYLDPNKKIAAGNPVPDFEVKLMDSNETVSKSSLLGKYYLLDFWATWCGPCVAEMPTMHKAWEQFKDKNFVILSLSFDQKPEIVKQFREKKWKMPWLHTFVKGGFESELAKKFEVLGIPKPILVSPKGIILATEGDLRGPNLERTLAGVL
ncbi:MAG: TlpA disulfide reductase family protein, partial [candidate division KSB1 bacterium]|nr:TlpA disulfide reductase family protein [candidate division KSB1 bacterium]